MVLVWTDWPKDAEACLKASATWPAWNSFDTGAVDGGQLDRASGLPLGVGEDDAGYLLAVPLVGLAEVLRDIILVDRLVSYFSNC
eukprot:16436083-Heterocapsa_arctica.AAC.1